MSAKVGRREVDFTSGPMLKKIILYALPIIGVNVLQLLFTMADLSVLGIFTGNDNAIAAVGATTPIINLCIGFLTGLAVGANVKIARLVGAKDEKQARVFVGTAIFISIVGGILLMILGVILAEQMLIWTNCAPTVLPYATKYLRIYFLGMPIIMVYNFCSAILRAVGDTARPLYFLIIGGILNVLLNIFFITVVGLDIEGVAIATVVSNSVSGICALVLMIKSDGYAKIERKYLKISKEELLDIVKIGLPIAISKCLFSFSNVIVSAKLNSLGDVAMTAHSITKEFDGFILEIVHAIDAASIAVISQNFGARKMERIKKVIFLTIAMQVVCSFILSGLLMVFGKTLCGIMTDTEIVLELCMVRIYSISIFYFLLGLLGVVQEAIRGIGYSLTSTLVSVFANIILRLIYIYFVYPFISIEGNLAHNLQMLYLLYPASWFVALVVATVILIVLFNHVKKKLEKEKELKREEL